MNMRGSNDEESLSPRWLKKVCYKDGFLNSGKPHDLLGYITITCSHMYVTMEISTSSGYVLCMNFPSFIALFTCGLISLSYTGLHDWPCY